MQARHVLLKWVGGGGSSCNVVPVVTGLMQSQSGPLILLASQCWCAAVCTAFVGHTNLYSMRAAAGQTHAGAFVFGGRGEGGLNDL